MSKDINLFKPPSLDACRSCVKTRKKVKSHKDPVELNKSHLDIVSDVHRQFLKSYNDSKYFVSFLDDWDKSSNIILFNRKSDTLVAF